MVKHNGLSKFHHGLAEFIVHRELSCDRKVATSTVYHELLISPFRHFLQFHWQFPSGEE